MSEQRLAEEPVRRESSGQGRFWLALVVMLLICAFAVYRSALFRLNTAQVTGAQRLSIERVMEIAGLTPGIARWELPAAKIEERLRQEPWIRSATAAWQWGRVRIEIEERNPVGLLKYHDMFYLALDETGVILEQVDLKAANGLPAISGVTVSQALRGQQLHHTGLRDALLVLASMAQPLREQVSEVQVPSDRSLVLFMTGGATVQFGMVPDAEAQRLPSIESKIKLLADPDLPRTGSSCYIDLRVDGMLSASKGCR